ncbi:hypothetical protein ES705_42776 [subsurface metagenome]
MNPVEKAARYRFAFGYSIGGSNVINSVPAISIALTTALSTSVERICVRTSELSIFLICVWLESARCACIWSPSAGVVGSVREPSTSSIEWISIAIVSVLLEGVGICISVYAFAADMSR